MTRQRQPELLITRPELTALTGLQDHQIAARERLTDTHFSQLARTVRRPLTPVTDGSRTGYPWEQVEQLVCRALPVTGPKISRAVVAMDLTYARRTVAELVRGTRAQGSGVGLAPGSGGAR